MTVNKRTPDQLRQQLIDGNFLIRCLLYGRSGTGKSSMASTFPGKKGIIDTDSGALVYKGDCDIRSITEDSTLNKGAKPEAWIDAVNVLNEFIKDDSIKVIVIDSFTTLSDACMKFILASVNRQGQTPTFVEWSRQMDLLTNFLFAAFSSNKNVISIFHEGMDKDELSGQIWCLPLVTGKLAQKIPGYHDEVYHMEPTKQNNVIKYQVLTKASNLYVAKSRLASIIDIPEKMCADFNFIVNRIGALHANTK